MHSVVTAFRVLEAVAERQPVGVSELARALELPKSTAQRNLSVLSDLGWIHAEHSSAKRWLLTTKALSLGGKVGDFAHLRSVALPSMQSLAHETQETLHLTVFEARYMVLVDKIESPRDVRVMSYIGGRVPCHLTASGKAFLSCFPDDEVSAMMGEEMEAMTPHTGTEGATLREQLEEARHRGYAININGWREDVSAVGSAIVGPDNRPQAALSISVPSHRFLEEMHASYGELVARGAAEASAKLTRSS